MSPLKKKAITRHQDLQEPTTASLGFEALLHVSLGNTVARKTPPAPQLPEITHLEFKCSVYMASFIYTRICLSFPQVNNFLGSETHQNVLILIIVRKHSPAATAILLSPSV